MGVPRVFVDCALASGKTLVLPGPASQHLVQVLRLRAGDTLVLFNGDGRDFSSTLATPSKTQAVVEIGAWGETEPPPMLALHLGIGVSKGERMDFALQKSVELGVSRITPLLTRRSVVRLSGERAERRARHWLGVIRSACEQSGRRRVPALEDARPLDAWVRDPHPFPLLLDHRSATSLPELSTPAGALTLLVGPEGGLEDAERTLALNAGFRGIRLGPRILRTETAPLAALAAIQALWGDFRA